MNEILVSLYGWLSNAYSTQLGVVVERNEMQQGGPPVALWRGEDLVGADCAELFDSDLGAWLRFRVLGEKTAVEAINKLVDGDIQWGLLQLASLSQKMRSDAHDPIGGWQIHLIWFVSKKHQDAWCKKMQAMRAESGFSEELGLDGIFFNEPSTLRPKLDRHRLPQLLFASRKLLSLSADKMPQWLRANEIFAAALKELPAQATAMDKQKTKAFVDELLKPGGIERPTIEPLPTTPNSANQCTKLTVQNVRNVERATLSLPVGKVVVVHGPNGSGKSSLFEALAIGVTGSSTTLKKYLDKDYERDLTPKDRTNYVANVLVNRRQREGATTVIRVNELPNSLETIASSFEEASERLKAADGTFLAQEDARNFVSLAGAELGLKILRGYSDLADKAQTHVDTQYNQSNQLYKEWLGEHGLNSAITQPTTRLTKLALMQLGKHVPSGGQGISNWLGSLAKRFPEATEPSSAAGLRWQRVDSPAGRDELCEKMANAEKLGFGVEMLEGWFKARLRALQAIDELDRIYEPRIQAITSRFQEIQEDLKSWAAWKTRQAQTPPVQAVPDATHELSTAPIAELEKALAELTRQGQDLSLRNEHLNSVVRDVLPKWKGSHPKDCPTCNAVHADGIESVVAGLQVIIQQQVDALRNTYREKQGQLKQHRSAQTTQDVCPLSDDRQRQLANLLNVELDGPQGLTALISLPDGHALIIQTITALAARPKLRDLMLACEPANEAAGRVYESISTIAAEGEALRIAPESWGRIKKLIDSSAASLVQQHLPNTLEAVWQEIAYGLTPARWNLWGDPRLIPNLSRGAQKLTVEIAPNTESDGPIGKNLLARYAFNQAEQHILGLAWFFTRYFSHGRFQQALMALDDPAQEMDQTTYRIFVRWIQAMSRLHVARKIPLSTVVFLHQEDRALDLARATNLSVVMIEWAAQMRTDGPHPTVKTLQLNNNDFKWPIPEPLRIAQGQRPLAPQV
jgi:AAA domain